jgi:hypothetical protein
MQGWALCNGGTYSYNATNYTTPNLQGQFIVGEGQNRITTSNGGGVSFGGSETLTKGEYGGVDEVFQASDELGKHSHSAGSLYMGYTGSHQHTYKYTEGSDSGSSVSVGDEDGVDDNGGRSDTSDEGAHTHELYGNVANNSYSGSQQAMPNIPPYYVVVYLMKLK